MGILSESIAAFVAGAPTDGAPAESRAIAVVGFLDTVGVMIAGAGEPVTQNLARHVRSTGGKPAARVMLGPDRATVAQAALIGTGAAHALDFDDYAYSNHVSALLVPALLAEGERQGAGGAALIDAYLAGYEVWGAVMKSEPDHLHSKGWHPTGVFGPVGVAAAIARLRRLDHGQVLDAIGLAAAAGGGVMDNFGTQAKPFQGARAAEAGVVAVELALAGLDAGPDALDGDGGLLAALSPRGRARRDVAIGPPDGNWLSAREGLNIKPHPTVGASQRGIDAALQIAADHGPDPAEIASVRVSISEKHAAVMRFHAPASALEAKFSLEFGVAAALIAGRVGLSELNDAFVARSDVKALMDKVTLDIGPDDDPDYPVGAIADTVTVTLRDGTVIESKPVRRFRGHHQNPMTRADLRAKFDDCVVPVVGADVANALFDALENLPTLAEVKDLPVVRPLP